MSTSNESKDPRLIKYKEIVEKRLGIIMPILNNPKDKSLYGKLAAEHDVCKRSLQRWVQRYNKDGLVGLAPNYKGSSSINRRYIFYDEGLEEAINMRRTDPKISVANIIYAIESKHPNWAGIFKRSTLQESLQKLHLAKRDLNTLAKLNNRTHYGRFKKLTPLESIQCDVKEFPKYATYDRNGVPCSMYVQLSVDNASRAIIAFKVWTDQKTHIVIDCIKSIVTTIGIPKSLHLDNGQIYRSKALTRACKLLGIKIKYCKPYSGFQKGVVERLNSLLNDIENQILAIPNLVFDAVVKLVEERIHQYNNTPHSSLLVNDKHLTPNEYFKRFCVQGRVITTEEADFIFKETAIRKVAKDGTIKFNNELYKVDMNKNHINDEIEFLINDDGSLEQILPDSYDTIPLPIFEIKEDIDFNTIRKLPATTQKLSIDYILGLLREKAKREGTYVDEESFLKEAYAELFVNGEVPTEARSFLNDLRSKNKALSQLSSSRASSTGESEATRGMNNQFSPFSNNDHEDDYE